MVSRVSSVQWMTSMNWPERKSKMGIVNGSFGKGSHRPRLPFVEQAAEDGAGLVRRHAGREVGVVEQAQQHFVMGGQPRKLVIVVEDRGARARAVIGQPQPLDRKSTRLNSS